VTRRSVWVVMLDGDEPVGVYTDEEFAREAAKYWWGLGGRVVEYTPKGGEEESDG